MPPCQAGCHIVHFTWLPGELNGVMQVEQMVSVGAQWMVGPWIHLVSSPSSSGQSVGEPTKSHQRTTPSLAGTLLLLPIALRAYQPGPTDCPCFALTVAHCLQATAQPGAVALTGPVQPCVLSPTAFLPPAQWHTCSPQGGFKQESRKPPGRNSGEILLPPGRPNNAQNHDSCCIIHNSQDTQTAQVYVC